MVTSEKDGYSNSTINARGGIQVSPDMNFDLRFHFTKASADLDRFGGTGGDDPTYIADTEESGIRGSVDLKLFDIWEHTAGASYSRNFRKYSFDQTPLHSSASRSRYDGNKTKFDWQSDLNLKNNIITAGLEFEEEKAESDYSRDRRLPLYFCIP
jgi:outer membrane cobalamin receptor